MPRVGCQWPLDTWSGPVQSCGTQQALHLESYGTKVSLVPCPADGNDPTLSQGWPRCHLSCLCCHPPCCAAVCLILPEHHQMTSPITRTVLPICSCEPRQPVPCAVLWEEDNDSPVSWINQTCSQQPYLVPPRAAQPFGLSLGKLRHGGSCSPVPLGQGPCSALPRQWHCLTAAPWLPSATSATLLVLPVLCAGGWLAGRLSPRLLSSPRCPSMSKFGCTSSGWYMALM